MIVKKIFNITSTRFRIYGHILPFTLVGSRNFHYVAMFMNPNHAQFFVKYLCFLINIRNNIKESVLKLVKKITKVGKRLKSSITNLVNGIGWSDIQKSSI